MLVNTAMVIVCGYKFKNQVNLLLALSVQIVLLLLLLELNVNLIAEKTYYVFDLVSD